VAEVAAERILLVGTRTCFEPPEGGLSCWGGRLRDQDAEPVPLVGVPKGRLVAGEGTACAITDDGAATCWGEDLNGRLSPGDEAAVGETSGSDQPPTRGAEASACPVKVKLPR
jgi:hypothetical protein